MTTLVRIADRAGANLFHLEDFVARELAGGKADPDGARRPRAEPLVVWYHGRPVRPFCSQPFVRPGWLVATHATPTSRQYRTSS